jgi:PAS domain S-box-containing protein
MPLWKHKELNLILLDESENYLAGNKAFSGLIQKYHHSKAQNGTENRKIDYKELVDHLFISDPKQKTIVLSLDDHQVKFTRIILSRKPFLIQLVELEDEAKNLALLQSLPEMYFVLDEEGLIQEFHAPDTAQLRISPEDMRQKPLKEMMSPHLFEQYLSTVKEVLETGEMVTREHQFDYPGGLVKYFHSRFVQIRGTRHVLSLAQDVTTLKNAQSKLTASMGELERSNKELEQFAYVASHDLQEPIRLIAGYNDLLQRNLPAEHIDEKSQMYLDFIIQSTERMKALINGLLEYSRIGNGELETESLDLGGLLKSSLLQFDRRLEESGTELTIDKMPEALICNPVQIGRLFQNLISNAVKFRSGDIKPKVYIRHKETDAEHTFSVEDNGIGIKEENFERLFVIFSRLNLREKYEGNGLGLTIVKRIVERHKGEIWVESQLGEGTIIHFTIPKKTTN